MAVKKQDLETILYRKKNVGEIHSTPRVVTDVEKNSANSIVSNLMGYILAAHS